MIKFISFKKILTEAPTDNMGDDTGKEAKPDQEDMFAADQPKPVQVKFDISKVKRYNPNKVFSQNFGFVKRISKQGVEVQADNHAIIFVNHEDLLDESKKAIKKMQLKEYIMPKQANESLTHFINFWNEYGPESLGQLDTQTINNLNQIDPTLGRDVNTLVQIFKRLQPYVDDYYQRFLGESILREETEKIKYAEYEDEKAPSLTTDKKSEATTIKKKYSPHELEINTGDADEYNDSSSNADQDRAAALALANTLVMTDFECFPKRIDIITDHVCDETYENPYKNDCIEVTMSNGDKISIDAYRGPAPWNPSVKVRKLIIKVGSKELVNTNSTDNWMINTAKYYLTYIKQKQK